MMQLDFTKLSRTVSHALRHAPWLYELELDEEGWVDVNLLLSALRQERWEWENLTEADLAEMVRLSDKKRFEWGDRQIRALYGHSLPGKLAKIPAQPPETLYHGTSPKVLEMIRREGLQPMSRQYVHLSVETETATSVGKRKSKQPVLLKIRALEAHQAGVTFYQGNEQVWLADVVPPQFIDE